MAADRRSNQHPIDLQSTRQFLNLIDPDASGFTYQTFDDSKKRRDRKLTRILHGPLEMHTAELIDLNQRGAGVLVVVNETDLRGRKSENIIGVRAIWQEDDDGFTDELPLPPSVVIETSPGKFHRYWLTKDLGLPEHRSVMERLVSDYGSDPNAKDSTRVMRLPGFYHQKGKPFQTRIVEANGKVYTRDEILKAFPPLPKDEPHQNPNNRSRESKFSSSPDWTNSDLREALDRIPAADRDEWLPVGMALHDQFGGSDEGFAIWNEWSQTAPEKFEHDEQVQTWNGFKLAAA